MLKMLISGYENTFNHITLYNAIVSLFTFQIGNKNFKDCIYTFTALQEITFLKICLHKSQGTLKDSK